MNSLYYTMQINQLSNRFRQIANTPNVLNMQFTAVDVAGIRESTIAIANECKANDPQIARQLLAAKDILFGTNQFGQTFINPYAIGEILFGLDYLSAKGQEPSAEEQTTAEIWSYIHPLIQKSSKKLFEDGHFANAAEDAFIEINARVKSLFSIVNPGSKVPDGDTAMTTVFSTNNPLIEFCDRSTETGYNKQKGYMQNLKVILTSENAFSNEVLKTDPSFGWAYYLARVAAKNINFSEYPFINLLIQQEKYTFLKETFDSLLNSGYLPKADIAFDMFSGQLPEIDHALREAQLHSLPQNIAVIGALSFYKLTDQNKYHRFICWIKENCIADAPNIHMHDLISIYDKVFENSPKSVFMSMKFGEETVNTYQTVKDVKEILKRENNIDLKIIKVDEHEDGYSDEIYHRIIDGIREASLVIADLSYGNKNVHHEIGYAQGIGKKVLLIYQIRDGIDPKEEIGSNISMHDQLRFTNIVELRSQLLKRIRNFFGIPESTD